MTPLLIAGEPVPVMPRAASAGSSPNGMRHLMAGTFKSYFTIDRERRLDAVPDRVVLVDRVAREVRRALGIRRRAAATTRRRPRARPRRSRSRDQLRRRARSFCRAASAPRTGQRAGATPASTGGRNQKRDEILDVRAAEMRERRHPPLAGRHHGANRRRVESRRAGGDVIRGIGGLVDERHTHVGAATLRAVADLTLLLIHRLTGANRPGGAAAGVRPDGTSRTMPGFSCATR